MPTVENPKRIPLPPSAEAILTEMFASYQRVVVKDDFSALGYSGSWVIRVHLLKEGTAPELPAVAKISSRSLIEKEWLAYQHCVQNQWPGIATGRGQPVIHDEWAGLCYPLMGGGLFRVKSLREYCLEAKVSDVTFVLRKRLFQIMKERILRPSIVEFEYPLRASYDAALPVNLLIETLSHDHDENLVSRSVTPEVIIANHNPLKCGNRVRVQGFIITKVDLRHRTVTLNLPAKKSNRYRLRLRLTEQQKIDPSLGVGDLMPPIEGIVIETRQSRFSDELKTLWPAFNAAGERVTLPDGTELPNPLCAIPAILDETRNLNFNCIHGDLNLENVLVDSQVRDVRLIDFAEARRDHVLHDFLRLETEVITKVLPVALSEADLPLELIHTFYQQLHCATFHFSGRGTHQLLHQALEKPFAILTEIRQAAREGFYKQEEFSEYYQVLLLYLVSTLRFKNLDSQAKQLAFWGAATIQQLLQQGSPCDEGLSGEKMNNSKFADLLNKYLSELERPPSWLARRLQVSLNTVEGWSAGQTTPAKPEMTSRIADILGIYERSERQTLLKAAAKTSSGSQKKQQTKASAASSKSIPISVTNINTGDGISTARDANIGGDVITGGNKNVFSGSFSGPIHSGRGNIYFNSSDKKVNPSLAEQIEALRQEVKSQKTSSQTQSAALRRINMLDDTLNVHELDLDLMASMLSWFQKHLPTLIKKVIEVISHSEVVKIVSALDVSTRSEYQQLLEKMSHLSTGH